MECYNMQITVTTLLKDTYIYNAKIITCDGEYITIIEFDDSKWEYPLCIIKELKGHDEKCN